MMVLDDISKEATKKVYTTDAVCLISSAVVLTISLVLAFFKKQLPNVISAFVCFIGTCLYIVPLAQLSNISGRDTSTITNRIYFSILATVFIACAIFANIMSDENRAIRIKKKKAKYDARYRRLRADERIDEES